MDGFGLQKYEKDGIKFLCLEKNRKFAPYFADILIKKQ